MRRIAILSVFALFAGFAVLSTPQAYAQATTGSIYGQVTDPSNAVVAGATLLAQNQATGVQYRAQSDKQGNYSIPTLPPGQYVVSAEMQGFSHATARDVLISIDRKQLINFELKVGTSTTEVTVTAAPTMLQTQSSETGEVIQSNDILDLPLLGRRFYDLTALTAGVSSVGGSINSFGFSVNGHREYSNSIQIDGVESTTNRTQDITATPSVDAVEEFKVATSGYSAEFGRSAGGEVSIQTKSGSNRWHGDAYEFFRPNFTAARDYGFLGAKTPPSILKQHNFGGTLGGPIRKDKTFFFISYEGTRKTSAGDGVFNTLPTNMISVLPNGSVDLSHLLDPFAGHCFNDGFCEAANQVTPIFDPSVSFNSFGGTAQQFPGNIIPAAQVSKAGLNTMLNFFAKPNLPGTLNGWFNNYQYHFPVTSRQKQADARLDHNFSEKDRFSLVFHYNDGQDLVENIYYGHTVVPGADDTDFANNQTSATQEYSFSEIHLFSPRFLNEARFGYTRYSLNQYSLLNGHDYSSQYGMANVGIPGFPATFAYPYIQLYSGYFTGGSSYKPLLIRDHNLQFTDNVTLSSVGKHDIKFGGDFRRLNSFPFFTIFPTGYQYYGAYFSPSTSDPTFKYYDPHYWFPNGGADIADLLVGIPYETDIGLQLTNPHTQSWELNFYGQDTFKLSPSLTLNYGLRYEYQAPYKEANGNASNYNPATDTFLLAGRGSNSAGLINSRLTNFAPRLGMAYQMYRKTVLRAGFGLFYSPENDGKEDLLARNYPFSTQSQYINYYYFGPPPYVLDSGVPRSTTIPIPSGATSVSTVPAGNGSVGTSLQTAYFVDPHVKTGYAEDYNLSIQQQLGSDFALEVAYVGSRSHRLSYLIGNINYNPAAPDPSHAVSPNLTKIQAMTDVGWSGYNALQTKLTKRVSRNLNFLATYTWSHAMDNGPAPFNLGSNNNFPQSPYDLNSEVASSDSDIRHSFTFSGLYRLPIGSGQRFFGNWGRAAEFALGGWQLNGIVAVRSGTPINIVRGASLTTCPGVRPNLVGNPDGPRTVTEWFNSDKNGAGSPFDVSPFTGSNSCVPGNMPRNLLTGPRYASADASIFKEFGFQERYKLQTRFEVFNLTNTAHFGNPDGVYTDGTFGQLTAPGTGSMRVVQLATKFIF